MAALSTILEVAREIMREHKKPMHVNDIAEQAVSSARNLNMTAEAFSGKLASALSAHVKTKKPVFLRVKDPKKGTNKKGVYRLKRQIQQAITARVDVPPARQAVSWKGRRVRRNERVAFLGVQRIAHDR
ncbi:HTH domain-containing protein [Humidesulfovibrio sp.]